MRPTGPTKESTRKLIVALEKYGKSTKQNIWLLVGEKLKKPRRSRIKVNIWKLARLAKKFKNQTIIVPGKVLGKGDLNEPIFIAAFDFSKEAKEKIQKAKGEVITLYELMNKKPKVSSLVIVG